MNNKELLRKILKILIENPYTSEVYLFGSQADQSSDEFSDIDLTVATPHPANAEAHMRKNIVDDFGINAVYTIAYGKHEIARSFCLANTNPFHKIDIGFSLPEKTVLFPNSKLIFQNNYIHTPNKKYVKKWTETRTEHDYFDVMMGSLRYIKYRRRNENWQAYKCYRGFIDQFAKLHTTNRSDENIFKALDKQNNDDILKLFFYSTIHEKEQHYRQFIEAFANNKQLLPEFSKDLLKCWKDYLGD